MKTLLFCTCLLNETSIFQYTEWWNYYRRNFPGVDMIMVNDGPIEKKILQKFQEVIKSDFKESDIHVFETKLGRNSHYHWGWWRSFKYALNYGKTKYNKILHIEYDAIILSTRLFDHLKNHSSGWSCLFTNNYGFGESAIQIINKDSYDLIDNLPDDFDFHTIAELVIPFRIDKSFIGDRYGEMGNIPKHKIDYACQWDWNWCIEKEWII